MIARAQAEHSRQRSLVARLTKDERDHIEQAGGLTGLRSKLRTARTAVRFAEATADILASVAEKPAAALPWTLHEHDNVVVEARTAQAEAEVLRAALERDRSILARAGSEVATDEAPRPATTDLHTIVSRWATETGAPAQHVEQYRYPVDRFYQLHGSIALQAITKAHLREFKDALAKLPRSTRRDLREASLQRAIAIADRENLPRIEPRTVTKHVAAIATMLRHALSWGYIEWNPADGFKLPQKRQKIAERKRRQPFTIDQMQTLKASLAAEYRTVDDDTGSLWLRLSKAVVSRRRCN